MVSMRLGAARWRNRNEHVFENITERISAVLNEQHSSGLFEFICCLKITREILSRACFQIGNPFEPRTCDNSTSPLPRVFRSVYTFLFRARSSRSRKGERNFMPTHSRRLFMRLSTHVYYQHFRLCAYCQGIRMDIEEKMNCVHYSSLPRFLSRDSYSTFRFHNFSQRVINDRLTLLPRV